MTSRPERGPVPDVPRLDDGAVTLRALRTSDIDAIVRHGADPLMQEWTRVPLDYTRRDAQDFLTHVAEGWRQGSEYGWAIETEGRLAGTLDLRPQGQGLAEIGYAGAAWARGRSVVTRAVRLAVAWGFESCGFEVVRWQAQVGNWASRRVAWATGFRFEGTVTALLEHRGRRVDGWIGSLRRGEAMQPLNRWWEPVDLAGRRVRLRAPRADDVPRLVEACRDERTQRWLPLVPNPYAADDAHRHQARFRERAALGEAVHWTVAGPDADEFLGEVAVFTHPGEPSSGEVGYLAHPDARGQGVITEGARLAVRHALIPAEDGGLGLDRVLLRAAVGNEASHGVARRLGFARAGVDRLGSRLRDGTLLDDVRYDLTVQDLGALLDDPADGA
ncbi:GNAT family N-acetyltransferase [Spongisporangium articulatum]|uniref:GNAT family N-acetyltransferase n=1 Tax=Spongisporangium articulatum TaxID=3362603 RepID=A0ABW8AJX8_9ACTN